jgi:hypothetical protein
MSSLNQRVSKDSIPETSNGRMEDAIRSKVGFCHYTVLLRLLTEDYILLMSFIYPGH